MALDRSTLLNSTIVLSCSYLLLYNYLLRNLQRGFETSLILIITNHCYYCICIMNETTVYYNNLIRTNIIISPHRRDNKNVHVV